MSVILSNQAGTDQVQGPDGTVYTADEQGRFELPDAFADVLLAVYVAGEKAWDSEGERQTRVLTKEQERRRDPAELLGAIERLGGFDEPKQGIVSDAFEDASAADLRKLAKELNTRANKLDPPAKRTRKPAAK